MTKEEFKKIQKEIGIKIRGMAKICGTSESMIKQIRGGQRAVSERFKNILFMYEMLDEKQKKEFHKSIDLVL